MAEGQTTTTTNTPISLETLFKNGFGIVTVFNAKLYSLAQGRKYIATEDLTPEHFDTSTTPEVLDTLKIANLTMEGPTKTITGGQYANPIIKYGKTMTLEMQDALGRSSTMTKFFGCEYVGEEEDKKDLIVGDKFPPAFALEGETFFIDRTTGNKEKVFIFIPQILPDALLSLTQDAEGDATVFDLNGTVCISRVGDKDIFYRISRTSFFATEEPAQN